MSKKSKPIPAPPCGTWLKSHFSWDKVGGTCQVGWGKIVIPSVVLCESSARRKRVQWRERERERPFFSLYKTHTRMINWWLLYNIELRQILLLHWILIFIFSQFIMSSIFRRKIGCYNIYFIIDIDQSCPREFAMLV